MLLIHVLAYFAVANAKDYECVSNLSEFWTHARGVFKFPNEFHCASVTDTVLSPYYEQNDPYCTANVGRNRLAYSLSNDATHVFYTLQSNFGINGLCIVDLAI